MCTESLEWPKVQWPLLGCLWSLSGNSASICHIIEVQSFIAAIKTFQMHCVIFAPAKVQTIVWKVRLTICQMLELRAQLSHTPPTCDFSSFFISISPNSIMVLKFVHSFDFLYHIEMANILLLTWSGSKLQAWKDIKPVKAYQLMHWYAVNSKLFILLLRVALSQHISKQFADMRWIT